MIGRPARSLLFAFALLAPAETLDRIAVTVGRYVISEQDLMRDIRVSAFLDGKDADLSAAAKRIPSVIESESGAWHADCLVRRD